MFVDTTFLIDILHGNQRAADFFKKHENTPLFTSEVNVFEVIRGIYRIEQPAGTHLEKANSLLSRFVVFSLDRKAAIKASIIDGRLTREGKKIGELDTLIAGIALSNGVNEIVTENKEHFEKISELKVWTY